jgi:hypothetical protein
MSPKSTGCWQEEVRAFLELPGGFGLLMPEATHVITCSILLLIGKPFHYSVIEGCKD